MLKLPVTVFFMALFSLGFSAEDRDNSCREQMVDLGFAVDSSGSIARSDFEKEKKFIQKIASHFNITENGIHGGAVVFSSYVLLSIKFSNHTNTSSFNNAVEGLPYMGYQSRIDAALWLADTGLFTKRGNSRLGAKKLLLLITDGSQNPKTKGKKYNPMQYAEKLRARNVQIHAVGIGKGISLPELKGIAKDPGRVYTVNDFDKLNDDEFVSNLFTKLCQDLKKGPEKVPVTEKPTTKKHKAEMFNLELRRAEAPKPETLIIEPFKRESIKPEIPEMEKPKVNSIKEPCKCSEGPCDCPCGSTGCDEQPFYLTIFQGSNNYVDKGQEVTQTGIGSSAGFIHPSGDLPSTNSIKRLSNEQIGNYIKSLIPYYDSVNKGLKNLLASSLKNKISRNAPNKK